MSDLPLMSILTRALQNNSRFRVKANCSRVLVDTCREIFDYLRACVKLELGSTVFQNLCLGKVNWDDRLEGEALIKWNGLIHELSVLTNLQIPRCCLMKDQVVLSCELHGFSDASERAYAAVVYLKIVYY